MLVVVFTITTACIMAVFSYQTSGMRELLSANISQNQQASFRPRLNAVDTRISAAASSVEAMLA